MEENKTRDLSIEKSAAKYKIKELHFSSAIPNISDTLILVTTDQGQVVSFNQTCEEISGYSFAEVQGKYIWDLFPKNESKVVKERYNRLKQGELINTGDTIWTNKLGEKRTVKWTNTVVVNQEGGVEYIVSSGVDLTEYKEAEVLYKTVFENTGDVTAIIEADMSISMVNKEITKIGYTKEELEGKTWIQLFPRSELKKLKKYHSLRRENPNAAPLKYKTRIKDKEGKFKDALAIVDMIPGTQKSVATLIDISEQTRINRALKTLIACNNAITHTINEDSLLNSVCRKIVRLGGYQMAWVGFTNGENAITSVAHAEDADGYWDTINYTSAASKGLESVYKAIQTGKVTLCTDIMTASDCIYQSFIALPLKNKGANPFGALVI